MDVGAVTQSKKERKKNYNCSVCNKSFKDNYKLKRHERIHVKAGELPEPEPEAEPEPEIDIGKSKYCFEILPLGGNQLKFDYRMIRLGLGPSSGLFQMTFNQKRTVLFILENIFYLPL